MKRILIIMVVLMLAGIQMAAAADVCPEGNEQIKFEDDTGIDFGNVTVGDTFTLPIPDSSGSITIEITAVKDGKEAMAFNWTSDEAVCYMLVKAGNDDSGWIEIAGATSGYGTTPTSAAISHITFCFGCDGGQDQEIPEFPTIALPIVAILGLAFFFQRRKE
jgi:hypothetical protein